MIVNIPEAKTRLSQMVDMVYHGEKVVIAKNNLPLVDMVPHKPEGKRCPGLLKGQIQVPDDFDQDDQEILDMFYGSEQ